MKVVTTLSELRAARDGFGRLAFVPTMGALHAGHVSLMRQAKLHAPTVAASIFVNPQQFTPHEDLTKSPRPIEKDLAMCEEAGVDLVFVPEVATVYPPGVSEVTLNVPQLSRRWEGERRPTHFAGVCLVVAKLFNMVKPQVACFGEKDFQQLAVIRAMTRALDFDIEIVGCPIVREPDGLAMSSRNVYLTREQRLRAAFISEALFAARDGSFDRVQDVIAFTSDRIMNVPDVLKGVPVQIDYLQLVDIDTLEPATDLSAPRQLITTVRVGLTWLLDNVRLEASSDRH